MGGSSADRYDFIINLMLILAGTMMVAMICAAVVAAIAFNRTGMGAAQAMNEAIQRAGIIQLLTVVAISMSLLILRLLDLVGADATVSVFSGIVGYVLGGLSKTLAADQPPGRLRARARTRAQFANSQNP